MVVSQVSVSISLNGVFYLLSLASDKLKFLLRISHLLEPCLIKFIFLVLVLLLCQVAHFTDLVLPCHNGSLCTPIADQLVLIFLAAFGRHALELFAITNVFLRPLGHPLHLGISGHLVLTFSTQSHLYQV